MPFGRLMMTSMLAACARGDTDTVLEVLRETRAAHGAAGVEAELAAVDDWAGSSPMHWAAYSGSRELVVRLREHILAQRRLHIITHAANTILKRHVERTWNDKF